MTILGEWILSNSIAAFVLSTIAFALGRRAKAPAVTHTLWVLVLIKLITPPLFRLPISLDLPFEPVAWKASSGPAETGQSEIVPAESRSVFDMESPVHATGSNGMTMGDGLLVCWIGGASLWFFVAARRSLGFRRLLSRAECVSAEMQALIDSVALKFDMGRSPRGVLVEATIPPLLNAFGGRAAIVFPKRLLNSLSTDEQETLVAHELAHYQRRDHWTRWLEFAVAGCFWWHPVVWWARRELHRTEETCCDAWVVSILPVSRKAYAKALLKTLDFLSEDAIRMPLIVCGLGERSGFKTIKQRFEMILKTKTNPRKSLVQSVAVGAFAAMLLPVSANLLPNNARASENPVSDPQAMNIENPDTSALEDRVAALETMVAKLTERAEPSRKSAEDQERARTDAKRERERLVRKLKDARTQDELEAKRMALVLEDSQAQYELTQKRQAEGKAREEDVRRAKLAAELSKVEAEKQRLMSEMQITEMEAAVDQLEVMARDDATKSGSDSAVE